MIPNAMKLVAGRTGQEYNQRIDLIENQIKEAVPEVKRTSIEAEAMRMRFSKERLGGTP